MKTAFETIDRAALATATGGVIQGNQFMDTMRNVYNNGVRRVLPMLPEMPKPPPQPQLPPGIA